MRVLRDARWLISGEKARFGYRKLKLLGHRISFNTIMPDPEKVEAFKRLLAPTSTKQLRAFLGLGGFYRKFVHRFAYIAAPLFKLLRDDEEWAWNSEQ